MSGRAYRCRHCQTAITFTNRIPHDEFGVHRCLSESRRHSIAPEPAEPGFDFGCAPDDESTPEAPKTEAEFSAAAQPLMDWLMRRGNPKMTVVVSQYDAIIRQEEIGTLNPNYRVRGDK